MIYFAATGTHTIRVQKREDGLWIDQIVLSPETYLNNAPGAGKNDTTMLPDGIGNAAAASAALPSPLQHVLYASSGAIVGTAWEKVAEPTAAGGWLIRNPDSGGAKINTALANPASYFELTFNAEANTAYRLWIRGRAQNDYWGNDSVHVQFSDSLNESGAPAFRIGTTDAAWVNLEDCGSCGVSGWGWQDDGYGEDVLGPLIYFAAGGTHTLRVQAREDGFSLDQIVLSAADYLNTAPGALKNDTTILVRREANVGYGCGCASWRRTTTGERLRARAVLRQRDAAGTPAYRIGTTGAAWVNLEDCSGCGVAGWGWQDNGYG